MLREVSVLRFDMRNRRGPDCTGENFLTGSTERNRVMEASTGFEPVYTDLQSAA